MTDTYQHNTAKPHPHLIHGVSHGNLHSDQFVCQIIVLPLQPHPVLQQVPMLSLQPDPRVLLKSLLFCCVFGRQVWLAWLVLNWGLLGYWVLAEVWVGVVMGWFSSVLDVHVLVWFNKVQTLNKVLRLEIHSMKWNVGETGIALMCMVIITDWHVWLGRVQTNG